MKNKLIKFTYIIGAILLVLLLIGYFYQVHFYKTHFLKGTYTNGADVSCMTIADLETALDQYNLHIQELTSDGTYISETLTGDSVGLKIQNREVLEQLLEEQNRWLWFKKGNQIQNQEYQLTLDGNMFQNSVKNLKCFNKEFAHSPVDASLSEYKKGFGYEIIKDEQGNLLNEAKTLETLLKAILSLQTDVNLSDTDCYQLPKVKSNNKRLNAIVSKLNHYVNTTITYEFGEHTEILDGDTIKNWLSVDQSDVVLNEEAVQEYVSNLKKKYDTIFRSKEFQTSYGTKIVLKDGDYGWWMNYSAEAKELIEQLNAGQSGTRTPVYYQTAAQYGKNDYGNTYVEINLTAQHLFYYKDGKRMMESRFVSGKLSNGNQTPPGVYGITYKEQYAVLVGEDYETPVSYWMPFNKNIGLHDATWRSQFGSNFYKNNGSHGCINMPYSAAKELYGYIEKGTPVICYELPGTESSAVREQSATEISQSVIDAINKIGEIKNNKESKKRVERARALYTKISSEARKLVINYNVLLDAESRLKEFK